MKTRIASSWRELLKNEFDKPYFTALTSFVSEQYRLHSASTFPAENEVFRAFETCKLEDLKVVILGQDPYPTKGHANGLCFSLRPEVKPLAKSLINIYKEIEADLACPIPQNGDLTRWSRQGVLLLNSILTVHEGQPLSHKNQGWETFTTAVIEQIVKHKKGVVFMLWGSKAIEKIANISMEDHFVLTSVHPSPLSAYKGFLGCKHFSKANEFLKLSDKNEIYWGD